MLNAPTLVSKELFHEFDFDYRVTTCFVESNNKILVLQRGRRDGQYKKWGIPGGKLSENESSEQGLIRELLEETGVRFEIGSFDLLGQAHSANSHDGDYFLYLYYTTIDHVPEVVINPDEHLAHKWVSLEEFEEMNLLDSQGLAYQAVKSALVKKMGSKKRSFPASNPRKNQVNI